MTDTSMLQPCPQCDNGFDYSRANDAVPGPDGEPVQRGPEPCSVCGGYQVVPVPANETERGENE